MNSLKVLVVGHSHTGALRRGLTNYIDGELAHRYEIINLGSLPNKGKGADIPPEVRKAIAALHADVIVSAVHGNAHNIFGLVRHPQPFDFVVPKMPQLALDEDAVLLPYSSIVASFRAKAEAQTRLLFNLKTEFGLPMIHLQSPPPIPSEEHLRTYPGVFAEKIAEFGVAPALLRHKLWWTMSDIFHEACAALGVAYLQVPDCVKDNSGMLLEQFWNNDPTHGNALYGAAILRQVDDHISNQLQAGQLYEQ